ncbi:MAG: hypothetical protein HYX63_09265 [Gammaproteobacteria bacterium]|nr:hypothetical protein [Gammaproteobacteria bacterium]
MPPSKPARDTGSVSATITRDPREARCFLRPHGVFASKGPAFTLKLRDSSAAALAEVIPLLLCGEESAALAFTEFSTARELPPLLRFQFAQVATDESRHEMLLHGVRCALPVTMPDPLLMARVRRFFITVRDRDPGRYFARIASLDSAVCVVLGSLRRRSGPLAADPVLTALFGSIHRDEARHVEITRRWAMAYCRHPDAESAAHVLRTRLTALLRARATAFDVLGIDPDRLFARLSHVPRGLFA